VTFYIPGYAIPGYARIAIPYTNYAFIMNSLQTHIQSTWTMRRLEFHSVHSYDLLLQMAVATSGLLFLRTNRFG
jgi:hypothetical protein